MIQKPHQILDFSTAMGGWIRELFFSLAMAFSHKTWLPTINPVTPRDDGGFFNNPLVRPFLVPRGVAFGGGWATARQILMIRPGEDMYLSSLKPRIKSRWKLMYDDGFVVKHMIKVVHPEASCEFLKLIFHVVRHTMHRLDDIYDIWFILNIPFPKISSWIS